MSHVNHRQLFQKALAAGAQRNYELAAEICTQLAAERDDMPEALLFLGRSRHALGQFGPAVAAFGAYLEKKPNDQNGWFFMGRTFLSANRFSEALRCIKKSITLGKTDPHTLALAGFAELKLRHISRAISALEQAHTSAPQDERIFRAYINALTIHGVQELKHDNYDSARQLMDFVITNGVDSTATRLYRASAYRELGRITEALSDLSIASEYSPDDNSIILQRAVLLFSSGQADQGFALLNQLGMELPGPQDAPWTPEALEQWRALASLKAGAPKEALAIALSLIKKGVKDAGIRTLAAQANFELRRFSHAVSHFERAAEADPASAVIRMGLAMALWEEKRYADARRVLKAAASRGIDAFEASYLDVLCRAGEKAAPEELLPLVQNLLRSKPGDLRLMFILAESLYKTGRPDLAGPWFDDILKLNPENELASLYLIAIAESLNAPEMELRRYGEYIQAYPDNVKLRKEYVGKLAKTGQWKEALSIVEEGYTYDRARKSSDPFLALCYKNAGRYREAALHYRSLLSETPKHVEYLLGLAFCLDKSGSTKLAKELLERGSAFIRTEAKPYLALGVLLARLNETEKAAAAFSKANELAPADVRPLINLSRLYEKSGSAELAARFRQRAEKLGHKAKAL